ncbi:MAG: heavy-metal-associated domain-containing protein [Thermodesulfobacteriota bacterium]|jgi:thioredoxin-related protein|nr:heavy-metal-associated domain-containing protein [Candidatus Dadabacteria bacterium]|tara:strand:+ start:3388 stop:3741 length:354 start_codon:yes stop_codon:yes gene_type:complete
MKKNILLTIAILLILSPYSFSSNDSEHRLKMDYKASVGSVDPNGKIIKVNVNGLVCDFCARALEKVFMKEKSVSGLTVDLKAKEIKIYTKKNMNLEDNIIEKKIKDSGYIVSSIERL